MTNTVYPALTYILPLAKKLIAVPSTADNPEALKKALNLAKKELQGYFAIEEFESNGMQSLLVHNTDYKTRQFKIILNAHLDVVPGKEEQFHPTEREGKLYGRGAYDMKATAAVMLLLFKEIARQVNYPLGLQVVTDEENMSLHTTRYQIEKGVRADFVICGESASNLQPVTKTKGSLWITIKTKGRTAHGGYPWRGDNAILRLIDAVDKIKNAYPVPTQESWKTTINIAKIGTTNTAFNAVPADAYAYLDVRFIHEDKETILQTIKNSIPQDIEMEVAQNTLPTFVRDDDPFVEALQASIQNIRHEQKGTKSSHATSDIRFYNEVGCLGVEFGPTGQNQHADNEWVDIQSLEDYYHILKNFLLSIKE